MSILKTIQNNLDLARNVYPSALNYRYILLWFQKREDFIKTYVKEHWVIEGRHMLLTKWSLDFDLGKESSCYPIWVNLPRLRIHL
jgi:hypothetical protein